MHPTLIPYASPPHRLYCCVRGQEHSRQLYFLTAASEREPTTKSSNTWRTWEQVHFNSQLYFSDIKIKAEKCTVQDKRRGSHKINHSCIVVLLVCALRMPLSMGSSIHSRSFEHILRPHLAPMKEYVSQLSFIDHHHVEPPYS